MSLRLSFEQGWTMEFTARVLEEYRRFLSLAATASTPMTPSVIVDEAWHVHLLYSRSYWTMCDEVFGRPLHHDPNPGGGAQDRRHADQYRATLRAYAESFGKPPSDIWPASDAGDGDEEPTRWTLPSPDSVERRRSAALIAWAVLCSIAIATTARGSSVIADALGDPRFVDWYGVAGIGWTAFAVMRSRSRARTVWERPTHRQLDWLLAAASLPGLAIGSTAFVARLAWERPITILAIVWLLTSIGFVQFVSNRWAGGFARDRIVAVTCVWAASSVPAVAAGWTRLVWLPTAIVATVWLARSVPNVRSTPIDTLDDLQVCALNDRRSAPGWSALASLSERRIVQVTDDAVMLCRSVAGERLDRVERLVVEALMEDSPVPSSPVALVDRIDWGRDPLVEDLRERGLVKGRVRSAPLRRLVVPISLLGIGWWGSIQTLSPAVSIVSGVHLGYVALGVLVAELIPGATERGRYARTWIAMDIERTLAEPSLPADFATRVRAGAALSLMGPALAAAVPVVPGEDFDLTLGRVRSSGDGGGGCGGGGCGGGCGGC